MQPVSKAPLSTTPDAQPLDDAHGGNGSANGKPATGSAIQIPAVQMPMAELVKNDPPLLQLPELIASADSPADDDSQDALVTLGDDCQRDLGGHPPGDHEGGDARLAAVCGGQGERTLDRRAPHAWPGEYPAADAR